MTVYAKLFCKILDSSVWLEDVDTRIVWVTLLAAMDDTGLVAMATSANVARRANVTLEAATKALAVLEAPDLNSSDPEHEGRRLERVAGGWLVRNAEKYRAIATRADEKAANRDRVRRHRERKRSGNGATITDALPRTDGNGAVTQSHGSEAEAETEATTEAAAEERSTPSRRRRSGARTTDPDGFDAFWRAYPRHDDREKAQKAWRRLNPNQATQTRILEALDWQRQQPKWLKDRGEFVPYGATYLNNRRWEDEPTVAADPLEANAGVWDELDQRVRRRA